MRLLGVVFLLVATPSMARDGSGYTYFQQLTGEDSDHDRAHWDDVYSRHKGYLFGKEPAEFLVETFRELKAAGMLPAGRALDVAMGEGRNAVFLAKKGYDVVGVDISEVGVRKARRLARENGVRVSAVVADLTKYQIPPESYDLILVFFYLQRSLAPAIARGLKPGGILIFETYTTDQVRHDKAENRDFLLAKGELRKMFESKLAVVKYREVDDGKQAVARLVARKRAAGAR